MREVRLVIVTQVMTMQRAVILALPLIIILE